MLVRFLVLELLFQALSRYRKILVYTCISTIFCSRTVILQLLVVQVVWFLLQFLCLRCIARSAYVLNCGFIVILPCLLACNAVSLWYRKWCEALHCFCVIFYVHVSNTGTFCIKAGIVPWIESI